MVRNVKLTEEEFFAERKKVLATWKTGSDPLVNFEESIKYLQKRGG